MRIQIPDGPEIVVSGRLVALGFAAVFVIMALATSVYTVATHEQAMVLRFGKHVRTSEPGLHFKAPFLIETVHKVAVRTRDVEEFGFRTARGGAATNPARGRRGFEEESTMLTGDLNIVQVGWDVHFRRFEPTHYLFQVQEPIQTLRDIAQSVMREVVGDRASIQVLTVERIEIQEAARSMIQDTVNAMELGLTIVEVNLRWVRPPDEVIDSFHDLNRAEQDAQRFFEEASREYEERVPRARGTARRMIEEAEGYRTRRINVAQGESERFKSLLAEYEKAPTVTRRRMYLETMEQVLPNVREVVVTEGNGTAPPLPLFELGNRPRRAQGTTPRQGAAATQAEPPAVQTGGER
jgi:modulator of FtsH protease HflK